MNLPDNEEDQPLEEESVEELEYEPAEDEPVVVQHVDSQQLAHFVTQIKSAEQQVGEHIIRALQHDDTVAVLTTVVVGPNGQQQVLSAALNPKLMTEVQKVLQRAQKEREPEEPCVGFHCLIKPKGATDSRA
ncbi:MAG: hypothetical protein KDB14_06720 [Planctomycetales bacterium]|nr:hypothetical protein [Planctomycetales bacterium]